MRGRRLTHRDWEPRSPPGSAGQVAPTWRWSSPPIATATGRLWVPPEPGLSARRYRAIDQVSRRGARVYSARMSGIVTWNTGRRRVAATLVACLVGTWLAALAPLPALAHEGDSDQASVLVLQAIGIIVNKPGDMDEIGDKIDDALNAPKKEGVDLAQVQAAKDALDTGDMGQARTLLQQSLQGGARLVVRDTGGTTMWPGRGHGTGHGRHAPRHRRRRGHRGPCRGGPGGF